MHRCVRTSAFRVAALLGLLTGGNIIAAPVQREDACRAANRELPGFFVGPWEPVGDITLHNLSGDVVAYTFIFVRPEPEVAGPAQESNPAVFVAKTRAKLVSAGGVNNGNAPELYGGNRFATIVVSADDTEPPVLRCFRGLPLHVVKEADALLLAGKTTPGSVWRVRHCLMLGLFDEAFSLETENGSSSLVVDTRTRSVVTLTEAQTVARAKRAIKPDPEQVRKCQEAWKPYRQVKTEMDAGMGTTGPRGTRHKTLGRDTEDPLIGVPSRGK